MTSPVDVFFNISDRYVRRARLQPSLLTALPAALAVMAYFPGGLIGWGILWSALVTCGGTALLAQLARDRGKRKEPELFQTWAGKPTTRFLRHRTAPNPVILNRQHRRLQLLVTGIRIPTSDEERCDPAHADHVYDACTAFLIEKTRNKERFPLVFEENCNYGFRRNLWGMKPIGLTVSLLSVGAIALLFLIDFQNALMPPPLSFVCGGLILALIVGWIAWFTPSWVKIAADSYAERLLASCDSLESQQT